MWGALGVAVTIGCGPHGTPPATTTSGAGEHLMLAADRARLETVATARTSGARDDGYRIGPDDLLDVRIPDLLPANPRIDARAGSALSEAPPFQQGLRVNAAGEVAIPLLGPIHATGRTPTELEAAIASALRARGLLVAPQVTVQVIEHRSAVVAVVGSVEKPGLYPLTRPGATLSELVWAAGGPSKDAGRVVEFSPVAAKGQESRPIRIDLDLLLGDNPMATTGLSDPPVHPGDVVRVPAAGSVLVEGWVDKPGSYPVTRGLTLSGAVAAAGGQLYPADRTCVRVQRTLGPGVQHQLVVDLNAVADGSAPDLPITDGDVVRLEPSTVRLIPYGLWELARTMVHVGGSVPLF